MLIADKAWEPEWCVAIADFKSMVRTAKKLKYPIFCYVDQTSTIAGGVLLPFGMARTIIAIPLTVSSAVRL
ncbi:MAG: hypothetical protein ACOX1U_10400 [Saccharofermentanales bacterium]